MGILQRLEDILDKKTPIIEVSSYTKAQFNQDSFNTLMSKLASEPYFKLRSNNADEFILNVKGKTIGTCDQAGVLFGKNPTKNMYKNMKSRLKITLLNDRRLKVDSFEHIVCIEKEIESFKEMLKSRLDILIASIDGGYST